MGRIVYSGIDAVFAEFVSDYSSIRFSSYARGTGQPGVSADVSWEAETWHFLVFTWDDAVNERSLYGDGELEDSDAYSAPSISSDTVAWLWTFGGRELGGAVSRIVTFSRALTAGEVAALYRTDTASLLRR
jgi:hypothetical protein